MGTNVTLLTNIFVKCLGPQLGGPKRYLDIGSQHLFGGSVEDYSRCIRYATGMSTLTPSQERGCEDLASRSYGACTKQAFCSELFSLMQWDYQSIDLYNGTISADLNVYQIEPRFIGHFDFVANFGTTEHVFNQFLCFRNMHYATAVGGHMIHSLPTSGFFNHCLYSYNPKMFLLLAEANKYRIVHAGMCPQGDPAPIDQRHSLWADYEGMAKLKFSDVVVEFILQKTEATDFQICYDVKGNDYEIPQIFEKQCGSLRYGPAIL